MRLRTRLRGESNGTGTRELWLRDDDVPKRMVVENRNATPSFVGPVNYLERYELELAEPSRG